MTNSDPHTVSSPLVPRGSTFHLSWLLPPPWFYRWGVILTGSQGQGDIVIHHPIVCYVMKTRTQAGAREV